MLHPKLNWYLLYNQVQNSLCSDFPQKNFFQSFVLKSTFLHLARGLTWDYQIAQIR